ncbi:MAG: hypothetical protein WAO28_00720 [Candidatus Microsaccharimonas sp.]
MSDKKHNRSSVIAASIVSIVIFAFAGWLLLNKQFVIDQVSIWSYDMPANVLALEDRIEYSDQGKFYFRATQPKLSGSKDFNLGCPRQEPGSPILGCYTDGRIFIYDITDNQLDGIEEVTAAHEMLHAVWERMGDSEQQRIGKLLRAAYAKIDDPDLKERMDYYNRTEPGEFENELHSIIGTETGNLGTELDTYYAKFFKDRQKVLDFHVKYSAVFKDLQTRSEALYNELVSIGKSVETRSAQYAIDVAALSADIQAFNAKADNGEFTSLSQFNSERAALVARTNQLDADRIAINNDIKTYNEKYTEYQKLGMQIESLNKSIDSIKDLAPAPSV